MSSQRPNRSDYSETPRQKAKRTTLQEIIRGCFGIIIALIGVTVAVSLTVNILPSPNGPVDEKVTIAAFVFQTIINWLQPPATAPATATPTPDISMTNISQTATAIGITQTALEQTLQARTNTLEPTLSSTFSPAPTITSTPTPQPTFTNTRTPVATFTIKYLPTRSTPTPRPTPLGLNDVLHNQNITIELTDYRFTARNSPDEAAIWLKVRFTNQGDKAAEIRFSESDLYGISDDAESYSDYITSFLNYVEHDSGCFYIGEWNTPDPNITLFLEANVIQTHEFILHRDMAELEERCPNNSSEYRSRVSIGSNWVDVSLPLDIQNEGERTTSFTAKWRLVRP